MKTTLIIIGSAVALVLLIVRMVFIQIDKADEKRREFVSNLDYHFAAMVDSVALVNPHAPVGFIYIKPLGDSVVHKEKKVSRKVDEKRKFRFLDPAGKGRFMMFSRDARLYNAGDSLYLDTSSDKMQLFHERSLVRDFIISEEVRD